MRLKNPRVKDETHLEFIRSLPCVSCGDNTATEAAHLRATNLAYGKPAPGMQAKPHDRWTLPLCGRCHREQHEGDEAMFWAFRGVNPWVLAMTLHGVSGDHEMACIVIERQKSELVKR
jgi:hypothetical protein